MAVGGRTIEAVADESGLFSLPWEGEPEIALTVKAKGFAPYHQTRRVTEGQSLMLVLWPMAFRDEVTVAARLREEGVGQMAPSVTVLTSDDLAATAAPALDDALRQVPGFSLFRRQGGRWANPTAQGPTLRGLGGSGAARALVLDDGVPLNDPFGGWVYWSRVPSPLVEQVEVRRGGGSHLFGSGALAGVIHLVRPRRDQRRLALELSGGTQRVWQGAALVRGTQKGVSIELAVDGFTTTGYHLLESRNRGTVDRRVRSRHLSEEVSLQQTWSAGTRVFGRGSMFREPRKNGTRLQTNDTEIRQLVAGLDRPRPRHALAVRTYLSSQLFEQAFSAVAADRRSERLTREQEVSSDSKGLSLRWTLGMGERRSLLGFEWSEVEGTNHETIPGAESTPMVADGRQRRRGVFADVGWGLGGRGSLSAGLRFDQWTNQDAHRTSNGRTTALADRSARAFSPQAGAFVRLGPRLALSASAYRAFRAPTLNELYRTFRVGDVSTLANEGLRAERLSGAEAGLVASLGALSFRGQAFRLEARDTVANVTVRVEPGLITRQRQNLGRIRSQGLEADAELRVGDFGLGLGFLGADATVRSFPADVGLEGKRLPQVPRRQLTLQARYGHAGGPRLGLQGRWAGTQYDDDRNQFRLGALRTFDLLAAVPVLPSLELFLAGENVLNERYEVGRTPLPTLGPPRSLRLGIRLQRTIKTREGTDLNPTPFGGRNP